MNSVCGCGRFWIEHTLREARACRNTTHPAPCPPPAPVERARDEKPRLRHGTRSSYNLGCRCEECREADRLYMRRPEQAARRREYMRRRRARLRRDTA